MLDIRRTKNIGGFMFKKIMPLYLLVSVYAYIALVVLMLWIGEGLSITALVVTIAVHLVLVFSSYIPNIVYAIRLLKVDADDRTIMIWVVLLKVLFIPIYLIIFLLGIVTSINPMTWVFTIVFIIFDYSLLLASSAYGVVVIIKAHRQSKLTTSSMITHIIFHFIFVLDIISSIWIYFKIRAKNKKAIEGH